MAEILIQPEECRTEAGNMASAAEEARASFDDMRGRLDALSESFRGRAQTAFDAKYGEWEQGATQVIEALEGLSQWLEGAANALEDTDSQIAGQLG